MNKIIYISIYLLIGLSANSQKIDSLIQLKSTPFLKDLIQQPFIAEAVEIDNPYQSSPEYEMVKPLGLRILKMNKQTYLHFNGSGLLYALDKKLDSVLVFRRLDITNNFKYNINAFVFTYQDKIYNIGGYGFWRTTGTLRSFNEKSKEWDVEPTNEEICTPAQSGLTSILQDQGKIFIPYQLSKNDGIKQTNKEKSLDEHVYSLDLATKNWEKIGKTDPELIQLIKEAAWKIATDFGLIISYKNKVYQIHYRTNEVFVYEKNSSLSQTLERIYYDYYKYYSNGTIYYSDKNTGSYDSLKIPLTQFVKSNIKIWKNNNRYYLIVLFGILLFATLIVVKKWIKRKSTESITTISDEPNSSLPKIKFSETEKNLLNLLLERSKNNKATGIFEINYTLGIKDKNLGIQKKVRSEVINSINDKFSYLQASSTPLIGNVRSEEDKRYFEYFIEKTNIDLLENMLLEDKE